MDKRESFFLRLTALSLILLCGCVDQSVVCKAPYMRNGSTCCLDRNVNGLCDADETTAVTSTTTTASTSSTTTSSTIPATSTSTTTARTTASTRTTTVTSSTVGDDQLCGKRYCAARYGTCGCSIINRMEGARGCARYGIITQICSGSAEIMDCDTKETHPCGKGTRCQMTGSGGHCVTA